MMLTSSESRLVNALIDRLHPFKSVRKVLQAGGTFVRDTRAISDVVMEDYACTSNLLSSAVNTVMCPNFESAVVKTEWKNSSALYRDDKVSISMLLPHKIAWLIQ